MYTIKSFNDPLALQDYLNGALLSKPLNKVVTGLHGLTLQIRAGNTTITTMFSDPTGAGLSPKQILDAVLATDPKLAAAVVLKSYGYTHSSSPQLALVGIGYKLLGAGTANPILGFPNTDHEISEIDEESIQGSPFVNPMGPLYHVVLHS